MRALAQAPSAESSTRENRSTFPLGVLAAMLVCAAAFLGIGAPAASAAPEAAPAWSYKLTFGMEQNVGEGNLRNEVALDSSGNIFTQQTNQGFVAVYKPSAPEGGEYLTAVAAGPLLSNIAIDQSDDALYAAESIYYGGSMIKRWLSDGQPTPTYTLDPSFEVPEGDGFGVDPTSGDILVTDPGGEAVKRYDDTGALVETISTPGIASSWILMMADGSFYVASASGPDLTHFSGSGTLLGTIVGVGTLRGLSYDPVRELLVSSVGDQLKSYSLAGVLVSSSPSKGGGAGTVVDPSGLLYEENTSGSVNVYKAAVQPGVESPIVSEITGHSAHIEAEVEPGEEGGLGEAPAGSKAHLEYSTDGGLNWIRLPDKELSEKGVAIVEADLTGLLANFEYKARVVAENSAGFEVISDAVSFSTLKIAPEVETGAASGLGETSATLNGTINPNGLQTTYHFEYGVTASYGSRVPVAVDAVAGNQRSSRSFSNSVSGLSPGTTYHYRIVAQSAVGESVGADRTFTTAAAGGSAPARAYEMVTPVNKRGAQESSDLSYQAADDGSAIVVNVSSGPSDGESALIRQGYALWRGTDGWSDWVNTDPPLAAAPGIFEAATLGISKDFTKAFVVSNRDLAPGGIADGGNLYVKDLRTGTYTFVAGAPGNFSYRSLAGVSVTHQVFAGAAPDFSWILFWSDLPLVPGAGDRNLYRWTPEGGLKLESRLPDGSVPSYPLAVSPVNDGRVELPVSSADGSLVAFDLGKYLTGGVYVRENEQSTAISVSHRAVDDPSEVRPGVLDWVTPSGRYVFFHTPDVAQLTEDTPPPSGPENLYRYDTKTHELIFVGQVTGSVNTLAFVGASPDGETAYFSGVSGTVVWHEDQLDSVTSAFNTGSMSENGRYFLFNENGEAHLYDSESGDSVCVSCPTDQSPPGGAHFKQSQRGISNRTTRSILADGTVFFDTPHPLLPSDHNSTQDVYSYKNGFLTLISPGNANFGAIFMEASKDGGDVFFRTEQGILPQDVDGSFDVYDARVGGGFPQPPTKVACSGEGCRGAVGGTPQGSAIGSSDSGQSSAASISSLKALSKSDRNRLAKGKKAHLKLQVSGPGKIKVIGTASGARVITASKQAARAGAVSVPIKLSRKGLSELNRKGLLAVRLTVSLGGEGQKVTSFTLKATAVNKGGSS